MKEKETLYFSGNRSVFLRRESLEIPAPGQVLVRAICSAISSGTELLAYRGQIPSNLALDANISEYKNSTTYPLRYGYTSVGEIVDADKPTKHLLGKKVFSFHPHESLFWKNPAELLEIPPNISMEAAAFLPNMETAVNLVMDGRPLIGEKVLVIGQGIVGLLVSSLLANFPLGGLFTTDFFKNRRLLSKKVGADLSLHPENSEELVQLDQSLASDSKNGAGADLIFELSGNPAALDFAIRCAGFGSRIVIGSWYGNKRATIGLGGNFHRNRIEIISSQVSSIRPELSGRWDKKRRFQLAWQQIRTQNPQQFITHRFPFSDAPEAYKLLDKSPENTGQVILTY